MRSSIRLPSQDTANVADHLFAMPANLSADLLKHECVLRSSLPTLPQELYRPTSPPAYCSFYSYPQVLRAVPTRIFVTCSDFAP